VAAQEGEGIGSKDNTMKKLFFRRVLAKIRQKILRLLLGNELFNTLFTLQKNSVIFEERLNSGLHVVTWHGDRLFTAMVKTTPKAALARVAVSLVEHCNLKCWGCDHLAPLAEEEFLDAEEFKNDMKRLADLMVGVSIINLLGGEPLLHPDIEKYIKIAREYFPHSVIRITTNGLLLHKQSDSFWDICRNNNIVIVVTKYPIDINWDKLSDKIKSKNVQFEYFGDTGAVLKTSYHIPFDVAGKQDTANNFLQCFHANDCVELYHGRLYTCTIVPHEKHFNKAFGYNMTECEKDSISIYEASSSEEILNHLAKPLPFCRYCNVQGRTFNHPWQQSKKDLSEWMI
jgi:hypothetical protein